MATIGVFTPTKEGGWAGTVRTLMMNAKVKFIPNDNRSSKKAPSFRIFSEGSEVGAAWEGTARSGGGVEFLDVKFDDLTWPSPLWATLRFERDGTEAILTWVRAKLKTQTDLPQRTPIIT